MLRSNPSYVFTIESEAEPYIRRALTYSMNTMQKKGIPYPNEENLLERFMKPSKKEQYRLDRSEIMTLCYSLRSSYEDKSSPFHQRGIDSFPVSLSYVCELHNRLATECQTRFKKKGRGKHAAR